MPKAPKKTKTTTRTDPGELVEISTVAGELQIAVSMGVSLRERRLFLVGDVDEELFKAFITAFSVMDTFEAPIYITFHSNGGSMEIGMAIYDAIRTARNHVTMDVAGAASSIGALILQAADTRRMMPESRIMIHQGKLFISGENQFQAHEMLEHAEDLKENNERYYNVLANSSKGKMSHSDVVKACKKDTYYDAQQAIDLGLVDEIVPYTKKKKN